MTHKARRRSRQGMTCEMADDVNMQEKGKETDGDRRGKTERTPTKQTEPECILINGLRSKATPTPY